MLRPPLLLLLAFASGVIVFVSSQAALEGVSRFGLVVSEIMYQPSEPSPAEQAAGFESATDFEFLELTNITDGSLLVSDYRLGGDINVAFSSSGIESVGVGESLVFVKNVEAFTLRYGDVIPIAGIFDGDLADEGGEFVLERSDGLEGLTIGSVIGI